MSNSRGAAPALLPVFRSRQQVEVLAFLLDEPDVELTASDLARLLAIPQPSVHRELARGEEAGILRSRRVGRSRLFGAATDSPYYEPLRQLLVMAFGVPKHVARAFASVDGVEALYVYGSWAARDAGVRGSRPVGDIDVLVLGRVDADQAYEAAAALRPVLGRDVQVTIRDADWLDEGSGTFHATVTSRPMVQVLPEVRRITEPTADTAARAR